MIELPGSLELRGRRGESSGGVEHSKPRSGKLALEGTVLATLFAAADHVGGGEVRSSGAEVVSGQCPKTATAGHVSGYVGGGDGCLSPRAAVAGHVLVGDQVGDVGEDEVSVLGESPVQVEERDALAMHVFTDFADPLGPLELSLGTVAVTENVELGIK